MSRHRRPTILPLLAITVLGGTACREPARPVPQPPPAGASAVATAPADPEADLAAPWEAQVGRGVTIEGVAHRDLTGAVFLRPAGDAYPYAVELPGVLRDLRGGHPLPVRATGTLRLHKYTVTQADVDEEARVRADPDIPGQGPDPDLRAGNVVRRFSLSEAVVVPLPPAAPPGRD